MHHMDILWEFLFLKIKYCISSSGWKPSDEQLYMFNWW